MEAVHWLVRQGRASVNVDRMGSNVLFKLKPESLSRMSRELLKVAKDLLAMEFPTQDAMDKYLKEHPAADRSNHRVVKTKPRTPAAPSQVSPPRQLVKTEEKSAKHQEIHDKLSRSPLSREMDFSHGECSVFATNLYSVLKDKGHNPKMAVFVKDGEPLHVTVVDDGQHVDHRGVSSEAEMMKRLKMGQGKVEEFDSPEDAENFVESLREKGSLHEMEFRAYPDLEKEISDVLEGKKP
jgi:hypothetical protein